MAAARQLSRVVLPAWVPPATSTLRPLATAASRNVAACRVSVPSRTRSSRCVGLDDELADVDLPVGPADVGDDDVQSRSVREDGVDERGAEVDPATAGLEHPLDEVAHLVGREDGRGQLGDAPARDEDLGGLVDPDLLDRGVVEVLLERSVTGHDRQYRMHGEARVAERRQPPVERSLVVVLHGVLHESPHGLGVARRVETRTADQLADLALDVADRFLCRHDCPLNPVSCFARHPARSAVIWRVQARAPAQRRDVVIHRSGAGPSPRDAPVRRPCSVAPWPQTRHRNRLRAPAEPVIHTCGRTLPSPDRAPWNGHTSNGHTSNGHMSNGTPGQGGSGAPDHHRHRPATRGRRPAARARRGARRARASQRFARSWPTWWACPAAASVPRAGRSPTRMSSGLPR